jgi:hypothetical protein
MGRPGHGRVRLPGHRGRRAGGVSQGQGSDDRRVRVACAVLAAIGPCTSKDSGEQSLARELYPWLEEDWLLIADQNFYNWQDWWDAADTGAALTHTRSAP